MNLSSDKILKYETKKLESNFNPNYNEKAVF